LISSFTSITVNENISNYTSFLLLITLNSALLGILTGREKKKNTTKLHANKKLILFLIISLCALPLFLYLLKNIPEIATNYSKYINKNIFSDEGYETNTSYFLNAFNNIVIRPITIISIIVGTSDLFLRRDIRLFILSFVLVLINSILYAKRIDLAYFFIIAVTGYVCSLKDKPTPKKNKNRMKAIF